MTPESRNSEVRIDFHCWATILQTHSGGKEYTSNNPGNFVAMQRRCKHAFPTTEAVFSAWSVKSDYKAEFH
jgi:hypothetical protein